MLISKIRWAAALVAVASPTIACAQGKLYVGAALGVSNTSGNYVEQVRNAGEPLPGFRYVTAGRDGGSDVGGRLSVGYQLHERVAVELGYTNFGKQNIVYQFRKQTGLIPAQPLVTSHGQFKLDGATIDLLGNWPVNSVLTVNARVGIFSGTLRYREEQEFLNQGTTVFSKNDDFTKLHWGVGASYRFSKALEATLDYTQAQGVGKSFAWTAETNGRLNYGLFAAGIRYRF
jgi:opacity protein-like surface antigen